MVSAAASGDTVAAFTAHVVAPDDITTTTPDLSQAVTISTQTDFSLSWAAATQSGATMEVVISDEKTYGSIACTVMDSVANVVVPKALLGNFAAGDTGRVALTRLEATTFATGNVQGTLSVSTVGPAPSATFQ